MAKRWCKRIMVMYERETAGIKISVSPEYLEDQSVPEENRFLWSYTINIKNTSNRIVRLLSRSWVITDSNGRTEHIQGEGVIGEQPMIDPGKSFRYTSAAPLRTSSGFMGGSYEMQTESGERFAAEVPNFSLDRPYDHTSRH
jgi:ApaG protein